MPWADSELDFAVVDRAQTLGELLRLLFVLAEVGSGPKDAADALNDFDRHFTIDPETVGRWLRGQRRPSKAHLRLLVRFFQAQRLIGTPAAKDRVFIRIAAFYAGLHDHSFIQIAQARRPFYRIGTKFGEARREYQNAVAMAADLEVPYNVWSCVKKNQHESVELLFELQSILQAREQESLSAQTTRATSAIENKASGFLARNSRNDIYGAKNSSKLGKNLLIIRRLWSIISAILPWLKVTASNYQSDDR